MNILGIESTCDETGIAIINHEKKIIYDFLYSQAKEHEGYGGVIPELAARKHLDAIMMVYNRSDIDWNKIDYISYASGPGLIGCLLIGANFARGLAISLKKPIIPINHLEAHILSARFEFDIAFPYIALLISGGHTNIVFVEGVRQYKTIGETLDDALGECFDKVARLLFLSYPGGPEIEKKALYGDPLKYEIPKAMCDKKNADFSFSGIKTYISQLVKKNKDILTDNDVCDICASFQYTMSYILINKLKKSFNIIGSEYPIVVGGGVAANKFIRAELSNNFNKVYYPSLKICTDNGVMIANAALEIIQARLPNIPDNINPRLLI